MARWRLTEASYLKVPGTKWEYQEVDRMTGRPKRTQFDVPLVVNPHSGDDQKSYGQGPLSEDIYVVYAGSEQNGKDLIFEGPPNTGMVPIDDEAKEISAVWEKKWGVSPTMSLDPEAQNQSYTAQLLSGLIDKMTEVKQGVQAAPVAPGMNEFMLTMQQMMLKQTEILASLAARAPEPEPPPNVSRIRRAPLEPRVSG